MNRKELEEVILSKENQISLLKKEILQLNRECLLLCDEEQRFEEKMETITIREGRRKIKVEKLIGRVYWKEKFLDEGTGEEIVIERSQPVRVDGEWDY